ncbi:cyclophilin-like fold protein [Glycomyces arizonensis]|uniref:cyclophilin-like fold protein n=1 Tax=Glycomyces arizonensis TaxID=256035 RepID=UPI0004241BE2|nr:cyclophilin-like fold protein [Glycomyces arizonensis]
MKRFAAARALMVLFTLAACTSSTGDGEGTASEPETTDEDSAPTGATGSETGAVTGDVVGTVVRFTSDATSVDVTIGEESPAARDFLSMLPLTIGVQEFNGREKISYLPRELAYEGSPGSDPEDGDLIYFVPWGNLGFYYDTEGVGYSDQTLHIGTFDASLDKLERLEGEDITVEIVE